MGEMYEGIKEETNKKISGIFSKSKYNAINQIMNLIDEMISKLTKDTNKKLGGATKMIQDMNNCFSKGLETMERYQTQIQNVKNSMENMGHIFRDTLKIAKDHGTNSRQMTQRKLTHNYELVKEKNQKVTQKM